MNNVALAEVTDTVLIDEAAKRLLKRFRSKHGVDMKYGGFNFIIHEGKFYHVEDSLRDKSYFSDDFKTVRGRRS